MVFMPLTSRLTLNIGFGMLQVTLNVPVTEIPQLLMGSCINLHRVIPIPILLIHLVVGLLPLLQGVGIFVNYNGNHLTDTVTQLRESGGVYSNPMVTVNVVTIVGVLSIKLLLGHSKGGDTFFLLNPQVFHTPREGQFDHTCGFLMGQS